MVRVYGCFHCGGSEDPSVTHHILYTTLKYELDTGWLCQKCLRKLRMPDPMRVHSGLNYLDKHVNAAVGDYSVCSSIYPKNYERTFNR